MSVRVRPMPALGVVVRRPRGVFWARTGPDSHDHRFCLDMLHPVYGIDQQREKKGQPGELEVVRVWACAACWPKGDE